MKYAILPILILATSGCMVVNYKSNVSHVKTSTGDARSESATENLTEAETISPQLKAQIAEKLQAAENISGVKK